MASRSSDPAGIVLAAGASSRMGRPKALLRIAGRTALARCAETLAAGGCGRIVAVTGAHAAEIRAGADLPPETILVEHAGWATGRTGSLKAALAAVRDAPAAVLLPVDHPFVLPADVAKLVKAWRPRRPPVVRLLRDGRGGHPVLVDRALFPEIEALADDEPLRSLLARHRPREEIVLGSPGVLLDLNTPEDLRRADPDAAAE